MYESSTFSILSDGKFFAAQNPNLANRKIQEYPFDLLYAGHLLNNATHFF